MRPGRKSGKIFERIELDENLDEGFLYEVFRERVELPAMCPRPAPQCRPQSGQKDYPQIRKGEFAFFSRRGKIEYPLRIVALTNRFLFQYSKYTGDCPAGTSTKSAGCKILTADHINR